MPVYLCQIRCCAQARLAGGEWVPLLPETHAGVPEVKWSPNRMRPFLCIGPSADATPGEREAEEFIEARLVALPKAEPEYPQSTCTSNEPHATVTTVTS